MFIVQENVHATLFLSPFSFQLGILVLVYYQIYLQIFTVSFPSCILLSPLYANALPGCLYYHPSIYLLILCELQYSLASYSQTTFCHLSMLDDPFYHLAMFHTHSPVGFKLLTVLSQHLFFYCLLLPCINFSLTSLVLILPQLGRGLTNA